MAKTKTIAKLADEAAVLLQKLVRLKAADDNGYVSCVTCGITRHYKDGMQGGHFISRRWNSLKLMEENIHPQCCACNAKHIGDGMQHEYTLFMIDTYGREFVDELISMKKPHKFYRLEVEEIIKETKAKIKEFEV